MKFKYLLKVIGGLVLFLIITACAQADEPMLTDTPSPTSTLAPVPTEDTNPRPFETISIDVPAFQQEVSGGTLTVSGYSEYFFESNLGVTICGTNPESGGKAHFICGTEKNVIVEGYATIESPDIGISGPYEGTLTYTVTEPTMARVVVYSASPMDGALEHLNSVLVTLNP